MSTRLDEAILKPHFRLMALVIPPGIQQLPQVQPQQAVQPKPEVVQHAQNRPIATQTQRAIAGPSRGRGANGAKSEEKQATAEADGKTAETGQAQRRRRDNGNVTIDV
jgi:hypothetical protein